MRWMVWGALVGGVGLSVLIQGVTGYAGWGWGMLGAFGGGIVGGLIAARKG